MASPSSFSDRVRVCGQSRQEPAGDGRSSPDLAEAKKGRLEALTDSLAHAVVELGNGRRPAPRACVRRGGAPPPQPRRCNGRAAGSLLPSSGQRRVDLHLLARSMVYLLFLAPPHHVGSPLLTTPASSSSTSRFCGFLGVPSTLNNSAKILHFAMNFEYSLLRNRLFKLQNCRFSVHISLSIYI